MKSTIPSLSAYISDSKAFYYRIRIRIRFRIRIHILLMLILPNILYPYFQHQTACYSRTIKSMDASYRRHNDDPLSISITDHQWVS